MLIFNKLSHLFTRCKFTIFFYFSKQKLSKYFIFLFFSVFR